MDIVNEKTTAYITVAFIDKTGAPAVPATITYSTKCKATGAEIKTNVAVPPAASIEIILDALDSTIQNSTNKQEDKLLTVRASYGANDECNSDYTWRVKNLSSV